MLLIFSFAHGFSFEKCLEMTFHYNITSHGTISHWIQLMREVISERLADQDEGKLGGEAKTAEID